MKLSKEFLLSATVLELAFIIAELMTIALSI